MRRVIRGKPLLVVTAAAAASAIAGCNDAHVPVDASVVSGNLSISLDGGPPDAGQVDASVVSGNLSVTIDSGPAPDAGDDGGTDGGP